jgi:hypothetical protein
MNQATWTAIDRSLNDLPGPSDSTLEATLAASAAGLPAINGRGIYFLNVNSG